MCSKCLGGVKIKNMKKLILFSLCSLLSVHCSLAQQYGWIDLSAGIPDSSTILHDAFFIGQEGWISGGIYPGNAQVYYSSNGGQNFITQNIPSGSGDWGMNIFMRSPEEGYLVTNTGHVLRTIDGGNGWITIGMGMGLLYSVSFPPLPELSGFVCSGNGSVYKITDSTVVQDFHLIGASFYSVCFPLNSNEGWVIGGTVIRHRNSSGWIIGDQNYSTGNTYNAIHFIDNQHGWAVGSPKSGQGTIIYTVNGSDWFNVTNAYDNNFTDVCFVNTQEGWIVGSNILLHSSDGGLTWIKEAENLTDSTFLTSVFAVNNHEVYVTGQKNLGNNQYKVLLLKYALIGGIEDDLAPSQMIMLQNQPNPFSESTVISWQVPVGSRQLAVCSHVTLKIFDFLGREIRTVVNEDMAPGEHQVNFDATGLPSGVYFYQLQANGTLETKKMVVRK
jgi:photosystem II stability/assembly factor-like uncharacterized protein